MTANNRARYKRRRDHAFRNIIECSVCKRKLVGDEKDKSNRYIYYRCSKKKDHPYMRYLKEEEFLAQTEAIVKGLSIPKALANWIQKSVDRRLNKQSKQQDKELEKLNRQLRLTEGKLQKVMDEGIIKGYDPEIVNHSINKYKQDIINIKSNNY